MRSFSGSGRSGRPQRSIWRRRFVCSTPSLYLLQSTIVRRGTNQPIRLNVAQQCWQSRIPWVSYRDHVTNEEVHCQTATRLLQGNVTERRVPAPTPTAQDRHHVDHHGRRKPGRGLSLRIYAPYTLHGMRPKQLQLIEYADGDLPPKAPNGVGRPKSK